MSQLFELNAPIIRAVVERLQTEMPGVIAQINAEASDGVVLENIADIFDYVPTPTILNRFPTIGVQDGPSDFADDTGWSATGVHDLVICIFVMNPDQQRLVQQLRGLTRAVANVVLRGRDISPAWGVTLNGILPGPTLGRGEEPREWISYSGVSVRFRADEDVLA